MVSRTTLGLLLGVVGVVIFGGSLPATRLAVLTLDPWFVTFGRAAIAGFCAILVLAVLRRPFPTREKWLALAISSACLCIGFPGLMGLSMLTVEAGHGGVVMALLPLATAIAGAIVTGERPSVAFWICAALGAALVVAFAWLRGAGGGISAGDLLLVSAVMLAAIGYAYAGRLSKIMPGWEVISWSVVLSLPITVPAAWWFAPAVPAEIPATAWIAFAYLGLGSMYFGFFFWNAGLAMGGVARVSQVQLLQTFVTLALAALINRETIDGVTIGFAVAVIAVVLVGRNLTVREGKP